MSSQIDPSRRAAPLLSVIIITRDEAHHIERCIRSVDFAGEVVVLDSGSTDDTCAIARRCGARVEVTEDWPGFGPQKNRVLSLAHGDWVLSIDADEQVDPRLEQSIMRAVQEPRHDGYWIHRASSFEGRRIRFGDWRNDRVLRLFRRDLARFSDDLVHERVLLDGSQGELAGILWHDSVESYEVGRQKMLRYAHLGADRLRERGRGGRIAALTHASWTFVRGYLLRLGFLDGRRGLSIAWLNTQGTFLRYLWAARPPSRTNPP